MENRGTLLGFCLVVLFTLIVGIHPVNGQPGVEWSKTYGGGHADWAESVIRTSDGGYALAGSTDSYGAGRDFWLVKTDSQGSEEWTKTYGGENGDGAYSVVQTKDGGYAIAGYTESYGAGIFDFWLVKTDSQGNEEWTKTYGGEGYDKAYSVVQTKDGGYAIAGETVSYGAGNNDFWLVKTDSQGNKEWSQTYGGKNRDGARSVVRDGDGGYAIAGETVSYGAGNNDFWLVKTDSQGNKEWTKTYGGEAHDWARSVVRDGDGGYAIVGYTESYGAGGDFWLVKTDSQGNKEWTKTYGGEKGERAHSVVQTKDGGYAIAGVSRTYGESWLVKVDSQGNKEWTKTYGGEANDWAWSVVRTGDGGYAIAGGTEFYGAGDFWLVKLSRESTEEGGELPFVWIAVGIGIAIAAVAGTVYAKKRDSGKEGEAVKRTFSSTRSGFSSRLVSVHWKSWIVLLFKHYFQEN